MAAVTQNHSHVQNRYQGRLKVEGLSYRSAVVRSRYVQTGTVPAADGTLPVADKRVPADDKGPEAVSGAMSLFILLVRLGTPSASVTNINAGAACFAPVVSARA